MRPVSKSVSQGELPHSGGGRTAGEVTPWQAPLAAGIYWALQNRPGPRLASGGHPPQLKHTYFRACLSQTGSKYRYDLVEASRGQDRLTMLGKVSRGQDRLTVLGHPSRGPDRLTMLGLEARALVGSSGRARCETA